MKIKKILLDNMINVALLFAGVYLFAFAFPNQFNDWGYGFLAFIALIPVFILIHRNGLVMNILWGFLYGWLTYRIFNFWLEEFNPVAHQVVPMVYAVYFMIFFPTVRWVEKKIPSHGWLIYTLFWVALEVFRTKGFLGYAYGIIGYTQYRFLRFIALADITGVLGVSALVVLPSALVAWRINYPPEEKKLLTWGKTLGIYSAVFLLANIYGWISTVDYQDSPVWRPALIQHNEDAWMNGMEIYKKSFEVLQQQSSLALEENPDVIIWPETAFVPAIEWHEHYRREQEKVLLIEKLRAILASSDTPFIIGNNDSKRVGGEKKSWNSVLLIEQGEIVDRYHKIHLVPFGEHFPYENIFPDFYQKIVDQGIAFYEKGDEYTVMETGGVRFGSLICFEDTFPYLSRNFARQGIDVLVNVSNDAWSKANASCMQHAAMAVFRSVENRRSMVRSTCSGFTASIDPNGKILDSLEPFTQGYLIAEVPLYTQRTTLFTRLGSWFDWLCVSASGLLIVYIMVNGYFEKKKKKEKK
jgi:apolipoprotein N-acyltransferase